MAQTTIIKLDHNQWQVIENFSQEIIGISKRRMRTELLGSSVILGFFSGYCYWNITNVQTMYRKEWRNAAIIAGFASLVCGGLFTFV